MNLATNRHVLVLVGAIISVCPPWVRPAHAGWTIQTVVSTETATEPSLVLNAQDRPIIGYHMWQGENWTRAKAAVWNGSSWNLQLVDDQNRSGWSSAITLDGSQHPLMSYHTSIPNMGLTYAAWNGSSWTAQSVDPGQAGWGSSIASGPGGAPAISYFAYEGPLTAMYASWNGSSWTTQSIAPVSFSGGGIYTSLKFGSDGNPRFTFGDNSGLKYAAWNGSAWGITTIDSGSAGSFNSMQLDGSGRPSVAYSAYLSGPLKYTSWNGASWDAPQTIATNPAPDQPISLALDQAGRPWIAYTDTSHNLKLSNWTGSAWQTDTIDSGAYSPSLDLDSHDNPVIAYHTAAQRLKLATYDAPPPPVVTGLSEPAPVSLISARRTDSFENLPLLPKISTESHVLATGLPGMQAGYTRHVFNSSGSQATFTAGNAFLGGQVTGVDLYAEGDPVSALSPSYQVETFSQGQGAFRVDAEPGLTTAEVSYRIEVPFTVSGFGSTAYDHPQYGLKAMYEVALVLAGRSDLAAFELWKSVMQDKMQQKTGLSIILPSLGPDGIPDIMGSLFSTAVWEALDRSYDSRFEAHVEAVLTSSILDIPRSPLGPWGYTTPTQSPAGRSERTDLMYVTGSFEVPTNTDIPYALSITTTGKVYGIAQAIARVHGYSLLLRESSTGQTILNSASVIGQSDSPWADPELMFGLDSIGDVRALDAVRDSSGQPLITPIEGTEFIMVVEHSPAMYSVSLPLGSDATTLNWDLDVLLTDLLTGPNQKSLSIVLSDMNGNWLDSLDQDIFAFNYAAFGPAEGFAWRTGFQHMSFDVSGVPGQGVLLSFYLYGQTSDTVRAGLLIDNIGGFAAPVPEPTTLGLLVIGVAGLWGHRRRLR